MTIELFKNNGIPYLRLVESRGIERRGAKVVQRRKTVLSIGPLSRHDDGRPDYLLRLRQSFRDGKPLIKSLEPFVGAVPRKEVLIPFREGDEKCLGEPKRMAAAILDPVFAALGLDELFASVKFASRIKYDLTGIVRLLVYGRLLDPASKRSTMGQSGGWHRPLVGESYQGCVYDALDVICANSAQIIRRMDTCVRRGAGRDAKVVFYDVTNFYFEIPWPDGDVLDAKGNVVAKGLRKLGVSKENRRQPIVQLGLFMDDNGIPISFGMFPGKDRGMYSGPNVLHAVDAGNGYIVAKSLRKSTKADVAWAADPKGYDRPGADFRCKSKVVTRTVKVVTKDKDGKDVVTERKLKEKIVVYWSRAFYERERHEHESFLSFVEKLKANPAGFRVTAAQPKDLRKFLKKEYLNKKTGEVLDGNELRAMIDDEKLEEFTGLMGYYQIATSELDMPDREVVEKYHGLTQIEDQFREMKGTLETRPVYVRTRDHVRAHLMVCFIALTMLRLIQRKTKASLGAELGGDLDWTYGIPGARLVKALADWQVDELPKGYLRMLNVTGDDIKTVLRAYGIEIQPRLYTKGDIRELKSAIQAF